jgi:hypothetical protein
MDSEKNFGFLYCVYNKQDKKYYIGMKQYKRGGKKTRARKLKNGKTVRKTNEKYGSPSNWKDYMTSSTELQGDVVTKGKKVFAFVCIKEYKTKGGLVYAEANLQHKLDVMISVDKKGEKLYYNKAVAAIRFVPKEYYNL